MMNVEDEDEELKGRIMGKNYRRRKGEFKGRMRSMRMIPDSRFPSTSLSVGAVRGRHRLQTWSLSGCAPAGR